MFTKEVLEFSEYEKYEITQQYKAYIYTYDFVTQERADEIEAELYSQGQKIFHVELNRQPKNLFELKIIVGVSPYTF